MEADEGQRKGVGAGSELGEIRNGGSKKRGTDVRRREPYLVTEWKMSDRLDSKEENKGRGKNDGRRTKKRKR